MLFFGNWFIKQLEPPKFDYETAYNNTVDGYYFNVPEGFQIDETFKPYTTRFVSENTVIEVYAEDCATKDERLSYINYTNKAIVENPVDYKNIKNYTDKDFNSILIWNRDTLDRIKNDKNYYLKLDIPEEEHVYTILVKSTEPQEDYTKYLNMIDFHEDFEYSIEPEKKVAISKTYNEETQNFYNTYLKGNDLTWGIFQPDYLKADTLKEYEKKIDYDFDILLWYTAFDKEYNSEKVRGFLDKAYSDNKIVELTLQPSLVHEEGNDLFRVLDGYYDEFLEEYAKDVAEFNHPVLFRFANEMNGDWCEYSGYRMSLDTELYREMYKYVYSFFEKHNADNVIWVWNPNGKSFPDFKWNIEDMYYPENEYVDVLGLTLYNTGSFYEGEYWTEFDVMYKPLYENSLEKYDMPFMITEFSCARVGGDKEDWTRKMFEDIKNYKNIKIAVWWNHADYTPDGETARAYFIDDSKEMIDIFKENLK